MQYGKTEPKPSSLVTSRPELTLDVRRRPPTAGQLVMTGPRLPHNWISHTESDVVVPIRDLVVQFRQELIPSIVAAAPELNPLLVLLERSRRGIEFISPNPKESEHWFNRMIEADDAARIPLLHYASDIPLATVAALVGMSESTFSRFFTKETGNGFTRFLNRVRVAKACELLGDSEVPITDICFAVGFNNVANFNRRFRELKAVTPREYRQQTRLRHNATRPAHTLG